MRTKFSIISAVAVAGLAVAIGFAQEPVAGPKLFVENQIIDAGKVARGELVEVEFKLVNEGSEALLIKAVRPTCGCTVADFDREIPAGARGAVKAKLDTSDFSGPVSKSILIMTSDPQDPTVTVVIKADVQPHIEVLPRPLIRFNALTQEEMSQNVVVVSSDLARPFKVTKVESSVPFINVGVRKLEGSERIAGQSEVQYEVAVSLAESAPVGPVNGVLTVFTDHPKAPEVQIKVYGVVRALLQVSPPQIQFGEVEAKVRPGRNVTLVSNRPGANPLQITDVTIDDPAFVTEVSAIEQGRRYQVKIAVDPEAPAGSHDAVLKLTTSDPQYPEVVIPVRATIR